MGPFPSLGLQRRSISAHFICQTVLKRGRPAHSRNPSVPSFFFFFPLSILKISLVLKKYPYSLRMTLHCPTNPPPQFPRLIPYESTDPFPISLGVFFSDLTLVWVVPPFFVQAGHFRAPLLPPSSRTAAETTTSLRFLPPIVVFPPPDFFVWCYQSV